MEAYLLQAVEPIHRVIKVPLRILEILIWVSPFCNPETHILSLAH